MSDLSFPKLLAGLVRIISAKPRVPRALHDNPSLATILNRRSIRQFTAEPIAPQIWETILEAGRLAPSTVNLQTWSFAHFTGEQWRDFFGSPIPFQASHGVVILADTHRVRSTLPEFPDAPLSEYTMGVMNASLAAMNMVQAAEAVGLGSVMLSETGRTGFYDAAHLAEILELPRGVVPIMSIVFGHTRAKSPVMPPKLPLEAVAFTGRYLETPAEVRDNWRDQMRAGYQVTHGGEKFSAKIAYYNRRIADTERDLRRLILGKEESKKETG
ncbi:MAG: nitroreductase family protein [Gemmatimonadales bacterium]|nr:nitroreductase family protein [Gemmatimonadales bacterium]